MHSVSHDNSRRYYVDVGGLNGFSLVDMHSLTNFSNLLIPIKMQLKAQRHLVSICAGGTLALAFLITGCTTPLGGVGDVPQDSLGQKVANETLQRARTSYDAGDYKRTLVILRSDGASPFAAADRNTRLEAMKLEAFSYCLVDQIQECRNQFLAILRAYPSFELSVAERSHPAWGPAFDWAKRAQR